MNFKTLSTELLNPQYTALSAIDATVLLNTKDITVKQSVSSADIRKYLMLVTKLIPLEAGTDVVAVESTRALGLFSSFDMTDSLVETKLISLLDGLVTATLITATDKAAILSLTTRLISRAEELGLPELVEANINYARTL